MTAIIAAAVLPTLGYVVIIWWLDRYEKEPLPLLLAAFLWGSVPAVLLELFFDRLLGGMSDPVLMAPLIEEPLKAWALVLLFAFFRREFDGILDGIIYGALVGFGFAMSENALYFSNAGDRLSMIVWLRVVLLGLGHAFFTSLPGMALGLVRYDRRSWVAPLALVGALAAAIFFHWLSNLAVTHGLLGLMVAWAVQSGGVLVVLLVAILTWRHELAWIEGELRAEIGTLLSAEEYRTLRSNRKRARSQLTALLSGGWTCFRYQRHRQHLLTEVALLKYQLRIGDSVFTSDDLNLLRQQVLDHRDDHICKGKAQAHA